MLFQAKAPYKQYTDEMYRNYNYYATWFPNNKRELGEIGTLKNNYFEHKGSLEEEHFPPSLCAGNIGGPIQNEIFASSTGVVVTPKISGKIAPTANALIQADAGFIVEFNKANSIYFAAMGTKIYFIKNQIALEKEIIRRYKNDRWKKEWAVITELVIADSATILISNMDEGCIELKAESNITTAGMNIADPSFRFKTIFSKNINTQIVAEENVTPLFKLRQIKDNIISTSFRRLGEGPEKRWISVEDVKFKPFEST